MSVNQPAPIIVSNPLLHKGAKQTMPTPALLRVLASRRMLVALAMGFASGLPLLLTISVLQAWMKEEGVDLAVIGLMALVGLPYTLKFLWAPVMDRFTLPFLGRRRGWLLVAQAALMVSISGLGFTDPGENPWMMAVAASLVTFFSASQDIVVDAYRREDLPDQELGMGSSLYVNGYRVGMLLASGGGLILADHMPFFMVYQIMAACMLPGPGYDRAFVGQNTFTARAVGKLHHLGDHFPSIRQFVRKSFCVL